MPNAILKRIVDCAHAMKINSKEDLQLETQWSCANIYSEEILTLIKIHHAPPEPVPAGISGTEPAGCTKCSRCGKKGHNKSNKKCPKYSSPSEKENIPPVQSACSIFLGITRSISYIFFYT
ncbi:hypothetical protein PILCRDRAFT_17201 [Piloderma croceum F 1598]|uniref:Uncharacterized protein n=1 Tax=Piloderma croceum (strain F 1598) TaxID=765440 RepID=A0A0C3ABX8_PILCF|nr:hypothetical protein PILCRDRAFT_17201 [Piloderma croceum F 1598]